MKHNRRFEKQLVTLLFVKYFSLNIIKTNKWRIAVTAGTVFQTENLGLNALKLRFWNIVTTTTAIQTEKAAVYEEWRHLYTK